MIGATQSLRPGIFGLQPAVRALTGFPPSLHPGGPGAQAPELPLQRARSRGPGGRRAAPRWCPRPAVRRGRARPRPADRSPSPARRRGVWTPFTTAVWPSTAMSAPIRVQLRHVHEAVLEDGLRDDRWCRRATRQERHELGLHVGGEAGDAPWSSTSTGCGRLGRPGSGARPASALDGGSPPRAACRSRASRCSGTAPLHAARRRR